MGIKVFAQNSLKVLFLPLLVLLAWSKSVALLSSELVLELADWCLFLIKESREERKARLEQRYREPLDPW